MNNINRFSTLLSQVQELRPDCYSSILYENFRTDMKNRKFIKELGEFLERESIFGYENEITNILLGEPDKKTINDLKKSFTEKEGIKIETVDVLEMDRTKLLERYLEIKNINSYTEAILNLWGQFRKDDSKITIKVKDKKLYHVKPSEFAKRVWVWHNEEMTGVPKLMSIFDLYNTEFFSGVSKKDYEILK